MEKYISDRIAVMRAGKIVELAGSEELYSNPLHPYTKSLLSIIPRPDPKSERNKEKLIYHEGNEINHGAGEDISFKEVTPGHFVMCTEAESTVFMSYRR